MATGGQKKINKKRNKIWGLVNGNTLSDLINRGLNAV